jgi:electron transfer flavoprotein alpha/beta subunit
VLAAGFEDVVTLPYTDQFQPRHTAGALAAYFRQNPVDLILTGRMVGAGDSGMVPVYLAEELGFAFFTDAVSASCDDEDHTLKMVCKEGNSLKTFSIPKGAVCTVGDAETPYLRLFPMKARMAAMKKTFTVWDDIEMAEPQQVLLRNEQLESSCQYLEQKEISEIAEQLLQFVKEATES